MSAMSELRFDDRVAVVTGGGTGLGASHARLLAARGAAVVVNDLDRHHAGEVAAEIIRSGGRAIVVTSDISTDDGAREPIDAAIDEYGRIDIVVNNAGVLRSAPFADMTAAVWDHVIAVNLRGTFLVTHAAWPHFVEPGERIAQAKLERVARAEWHKVDSVEALGATARGAGGHGSTGR